VGQDKEKQMKKLTVLTLCAMLFALCSSAEAQQPKNTRREFVIADLGGK
jgi:hypothetical protein